MFGVTASGYYQWRGRGKSNREQENISFLEKIKDTYELNRCVYGSPGLLNHNNHLRQSMSGKGNCYDNAMAKSFFKILKTELIYQNKYQTRQEVQQDIFEYIEVFYIRKRLHST
jgi:transposase InsO family protein